MARQAWRCLASAFRPSSRYHQPISSAVHSLNPEADRFSRYREISAPFLFLYRWAHILVLLSSFLASRWGSTPRRDTDTTNTDPPKDLASTTSLVRLVTRPAATCQNQDLYLPIIHHRYRPHRRHHRATKIRAHDKPVTSQRRSCPPWRTLISSWRTSSARSSEKRPSYTPHLR